MKTEISNSKLFWGIFFVSLGLFYILDLIPNYSHPYLINLKLFPLVFLFAGILLLKPNRSVTTIALVLLSLLLSSFVFSIYRYIKTESNFPYFFIFKIFGNVF